MPGRALSYAPPGEREVTKNPSGQTARLLTRLRLDGEADVVVDVSNVCKHHSSGGSWGSLLVVLDALATYLQVTRVGAILVVDNSLLRETGQNPLPPREREIAKLVIAECQALDPPNPFVLVGHADPEVIAQAVDHDARVVTNDGYQEYFKDHPWLNRGDGRKLGWVYRGQQVQILPAERRKVGEWTASGRKQRAELERLPPYARDELYDWWLICENRGCRKRGVRLVFGADEGSRWAHFKRCFVCTVCGKPVGKDGARPTARDFYVLWGEDTRVATYLIEEGESLTVGAGPEADVDAFREPGGIVRDLRRPTQEERERVAARHCRIRCQSGELAVTDLETRYGIRVRRMKHFEQVGVDELVPGQPARLRHGDVAVLGGVIGIRTSGKPLPHGARVNPR